MCVDNSAPRWQPGRLEERQGRRKGQGVPGVPRFPKAGFTRSVDCVERRPGARRGGRGPGGRRIIFPGKVGGRVYFCSSGVYVNEKKMELQTARDRAATASGTPRHGVPGPIKGRAGETFRRSPLTPSRRAAPISLSPPPPTHKIGSSVCNHRHLAPPQPAGAQSGLRIRKTLI